MQQQIYIFIQFLTLVLIQFVRLDNLHILFVSPGVEGTSNSGQMCRT
jgi:hypothetical protein